MTSYGHIRHTPSVITSGCFLASARHANIIIESFKISSKFCRFVCASTFLHTNSIETWQHNNILDYRKSTKKSQLKMNTLYSSSHLTHPLPKARSNANDKMYKCATKRIGFPSHFVSSDVGIGLSHFVCYQCT